MADGTLWHSGAFALLHDAETRAPARLFENPVSAIEAHVPGDVIPALDALDAARARGLHAVGFLAYEMGLALEPRLVARLERAQDPAPLLSFGLFEASRQLSADELATFLDGEGTLNAMTPAWSEDQYRARFERVQNLIAAGDVYQINLTFPLTGRCQGSPRALFAALQQRASARYSALMSLRDRHILSASPELFIESDGETIRARPMKGTAPRAALAHDDAALAAALRNDAKTRAENMMIVDLLRNDLGRIAQTGSVAARSLFDVETYPTLHQMTSTIEARLTPGAPLRDIMRALFPCGSVTGAPKIRVMEIIDELEATPRGVYCGAVGHLAPHGALRLNVAIRTLTVSRDGSAQIGVGSGLVFDSQGRAEYAECLLKARFLNAGGTFPALFETLRLERGAGYTLLDEHLERLHASAARLGYPCNDTQLRAALDDTSRTNEYAIARVRLMLMRDGEIKIDSHPFSGSLAEPMRLILSSRTMSSTDPLIYHKTTARGFYDGERARLADRGCDEVIFLNERGELTEGTFTNLFVERGGALLTPAVACGLLPGTLRRRLLATGAAREAVLYPHDLADADHVYIGNALRGLVDAHYIGAES